MTWILTNSGQRVDLAEPKQEQIDINDLAHHLAGINRFTGAGKFTLSVAEHSIRVSQYVEQRGQSPLICLLALLHDAHEAYIGDISTPLKRLLDQALAKAGTSVGAIAENFDQQIINALKLRPVVDYYPADIEAGSAVIAEADAACCEFERGLLLPNHPEWPIADWVRVTQERRGNKPIGVMGAERAKGAFLTRYAELRKKTLEKFEFDLNRAKSADSKDTLKEDEVIEINELDEDRGARIRTKKFDAIAAAANSLSGMKGSMG